MTQRHESIDAYLETLPVSMYPAPDGDADFERDIAAYRSGRGTLRLPVDQPMPFDLIRRAASLLAAGEPGAT